MLEHIESDKTVSFPPKTIKRFFSKIQKTDGCWNWIGYIMPNGYGQFGLNGRMKLSHRVSWRIHYGEIPGNLCVLHHCDNPRCVNPIHLFLGTCADNHKDMVAKNRSTRGERNPRAALKDADIPVIRDLLKTTKGVEVARRFGVSPACICLINRRMNWSHIL